MCSTQGRNEKCKQNFSWKTRRTIAIRCTEEENIGMTLKETGWEVSDWIHVS